LSDNKIIKSIEHMLNQHHKLYRFPVKAELWEDIFDQSINGWDSKWEGGGHSVGADVISEDVDRTRYQNKSGSININKNIIKWNGHRTTTHKTIEDKINFISKPHYDKYIMLGRNDKDWKNGIKRYWYIEFDSDKIDYTKLKWTEKYSKNGNLTGWVGTNDELPYSAVINKSQSDQLWTECDLNYLGKKTEIIIK